MADIDQLSSSRWSSRESSFSLCHMTESAYAKVIFCEIHDSYSAESDVECLYQLSESVVPNPDDYIGLFRVGWQDLSECITSVPCSSASCNSSLAGDSYNKIIFKVKDLPKDDLEYYQFLYLTKDHEICGASTPFKFHTVHEDENVVVLSAEHDFLEVKTSTSLLQHRLAETQKYVTFLEKAKKELENKIAAVEKEKDEAIAELEKRNLARQEFEVQLHFYLLSFIEGTKDLPAIPECSKTLESSLHNLKYVFDRLMKNNNALKMQASVLQRDLSKIKADFDSYKAKELELTVQNTALADSFKMSLQQLSLENSELKEEKYSLEKSLSDTKDLFRASEQCKCLVRQELENVKKSKDEMASSMEDLKLLNSLLKKQLANNEIAIKDMEKVWKELEEVKLNFDSEKESWDVHRSELEKQIDDLTARLKDGTFLQEKTDKHRSELEMQIGDLTTRLKETAFLQEQMDKHRSELEKQIDDLTARLKDATFLQEQTDKQCSELEQEIDGLTERLNKATVLREQKDKQCSELEREIDGLTERLNKATVLQEQKEKQCSELEQQIDNLTIRLKEAAELYKKQFLEIRTLKKALKAESSRRKHSSDRAMGSASEYPMCFSSDGVPLLEGAETSSSSSMSSLIQALDPFNPEQVIKTENKQLQSTPDSRPANLSGSYMAWSGCSSYADVHMGKASAPVEEETGFCDMTTSSASGMNDFLHLVMVTGNKKPSETVFVKSRTDCSSSASTSRSEAQQEQDVFPSGVDSHEEPTSLYHDSPEIFDLPCPLCDEVITVCGNNTTSMDHHLLNAHHQQLCPVCGRMFDTELPSNYFKYHVENHFASAQPNE